MALIRTPTMKNPLDEMPNLYNPMGTPPVSPPTPATDWNLYTTPTSAIPIPGTPPETRWPAPGIPSDQTRWPTRSFDDQTPPPTPTPPPPPPGGDTWENNWKNYWAPDRREKLLSLLERDYHAPDKQQRIDWLKNLSDAELWPHGKPGAPPATPPATPPPPKTYTAPPGVDQTKLNDPTHKTDKYRSVRILLDGGTIDDVLKELGPGWKKVSADTIMAPDGSLFDLFFDFGGPQQRVQWTYVGGGPDSGTPPPPAPPAPPTQPGTPPTTTAPPPPPPPTPPTTRGRGQPPAPPPTSSTPWTPGSHYTWQTKDSAKPIYNSVAAALEKALGRPPTPDEVWSRLDWDRQPDARFLQSILDDIAKAAPAAPPTTPPTDPYQDEYQKYLDEYLKMLASQRDRWEKDNQTFRQRQQQAQQSTERLLKFLEERSQKLLQPAYTGAEGEVFRTKALDPIEADRQAAKQRALQRISERGLDPKSGLAQQLLNDVDAAFDKARAGTQNQLAYSQITEQRSREQEAQNLLGMVPAIQNAAMRGDVEFLDMLDQQIRNTYREGMGPAQLKYNIPNDALQQALAALGLGGNPNQLLQMLMQMQQYNQGNSNALWGSLGSMLPYLMSLFGGGGNPWTETHGPPRY